MLKISLPATSANLGIGFDTLGMSLDIYNVFGFTKSKSYQTIGFDKPVKIENNLVLSAYLSFAETYLLKEMVQEVTIEQIESQIPFSRGLGSSATCILAGVLGANHMNNLGKPFEECVNFAAQIEGHPDNVFACAYGGVISAYYEEGTYYYEQFPVSSELEFEVLIPSTTGKTAALRSVLPTGVAYSDVVHNLSRIISLPNALKEGDFQGLKRILKDTLHEPYRFPYIPKANLIQNLNQDPDLIALISGSGPSILLIHPKENDPLLSQEILETYQHIKVKIGHKIKIEVSE